MAQNGFKHIAVTMPEDDDEVIVAGLPNVQASGPDAAADEGAGDGFDTFDDGGVSVVVEGDADVLSDERAAHESDALVDADGDAVDARSEAIQDGFDVSEASAAEAASEPAAAPVRAQRSSARSSQGKSGYEQPTLEDLQGEPMSMTQKIVIIAAVVCIIGAIIYYFVFMR